MAGDVGMEKGELKAMMTAAKGGQVSCAIGLAKDNSALIMMHKTKGAKAVEKDLSAKFTDMKLSRWGTVEIVEGTAKFIVNKATSGMAPRLSRSLKGTGVKKIEILLEDGTVVEGSAAEEEEGTEAQAEGGTGEQAQTKPDVAALETELRAMIGQMASADPSKVATLKASATMAATALKAGDAETAAAALAKMKETLEAKVTETATAPDAAPVSFVTMQKSRLLWDSARKKVAAEIEMLKDKAMEAFEGDPEETKVIDALDQLDEINATLDERLMDALDDVLNEQDPGKHAELLKEAKAILGEYASYVSSNELIKGLSGDTPFGVKLTIGPTYAAVIKALQANLR